MLSPPDPTEKTPINSGTATRRSKLRFKGRFRTPSNHTAPESSSTHVSSFTLRSTPNQTQAHPEAALRLSQLQGCSTVHVNGKAGSNQVSTQPTNLNEGPGSPLEDLRSVVNTAAASPTYSSALFGYVQSCLLAANDAVLLHQDLQAAAGYLRRAFNIAYVRHYPLGTTVPALDLAAARVEWTRVLAPFSEAGVWETFSRFCRVQGQEGQTALKTFLQGGSGPHALHPSADLFSKAAPFSVHLAESLRLRSEDLPFWYPRAQDNQVFGHDWLWDTVRQKFVYPLLFEDGRSSVMQTFVPVSRSLFLFGPAGCGKKFLAKAVAGLFDRTYAKLVAAPEAVDNAGLCAGVVANPDQRIFSPPEAEKATSQGTSGSLRMIVFSLKNLPQIRNTQGEGTAPTEAQTQQARQKSQEFSEAMVEAHRLLQKSADDEKWQTARRQFQVPPRRFVLLEAVELAEAVFAQFAGHVLASAHPGKHQFPNVCLIACSNRFLPRSLLATARFDVQVFVDLPGPEKRKHVIEETVLSSLFLGQGRRGACTARRGLRKNPVFQGTTAALAACLQPSTAGMMTTAQKMAATARQTGGAGVDYPRETEIERFFLEAALQRYYSFSPAVAKVAYKRWMQNPNKQKGILHLFATPPVPSVPDPLRKPPTNVTKAPESTQTAKTNTGLRILGPLQRGERVWFADSAGVQEAFVVQPSSSKEPQESDDQLVALSLVNDSLAMAKAPRVVPRIDVFTDEDRSRALLELSQFENTQTAFGNRSLAVRCTYLCHLFCKAAAAAAADDDENSMLLQVSENLRLLPGYLRQLVANETMDSDEKSSISGPKQENIHQKKLHLSFQTWIQRRPRVISKADNRSTNNATKQPKTLASWRDVQTQLNESTVGQEKWEKGFGRYIQDFDWLKPNPPSITAEFKGKQIFDAMVTYTTSTTKHSALFTLSVLMYVKEFAIPLKSYVLSKFFLSGDPVPGTAEESTPTANFNDGEFEEVVSTREKMFEKALAFSEDQKYEQVWFLYTAESVLKDPVLAMMIVTLVNQITSFKATHVQAQTVLVNNAVQDIKTCLQILHPWNYENLTGKLAAKLFPKRKPGDPNVQEGAVLLEAEEDQHLFDMVLQKEKLELVVNPPETQIRPKSFYFGDVPFVGLATTHSSASGEQKRLRQLESRIRTQVFSQREVYHGLSINEIAALVQQGVEEFLFDQLGLERDPVSGCMYYCANDVTCNECGFAPSVQDQVKFRTRVGKTAFGVDLINLFFVQEQDGHTNPGAETVSSTTSGQSLPDLLLRIEVLVRDSLHKKTAQTSTPVSSSAQPTAIELNKVRNHAEKVLQVLHRLRNVKFSSSSSKTFLETQQMMVQEAFENTQNFLVSGLFHRVYQSVLGGLELRASRSTLPFDTNFHENIHDSGKTFTEHYVQEFVFRAIQRKI